MQLKLAEIKLVK